ncbi:LpxL/LpxP family Kdo(2)-lipid IV(A) lauroyl/palmitoleoyl acyltransferase [Shewanella schlegeliana]|uniref:Lipid A biosynthesis acyltransferase n=1 Tax=Shewanella schlegeliana TaxID=190308 RepID=A0ABS1T6B1_9GAMM|nr:LpxL/LpxP family Kdo(2)-lipid IV(A) lauroyl/palmitoleoyl acyltransferase [Shewanella schlegeliana]MBL4915021.1 LpxL/LpxP family Kdo(2)-lipid IV(A) lauroyl/palmitoleoyl acyltransferase [Shewanella schlegeliana]MCL1110567.1 LpxL/LpxP family Kdo(2)-lipid IV(A) lauroyl/palmitoleoyl acyltransferase [Shewanella schlegeliana]GIU32286.1 lipid A biosynthesis lauroyltransferase [Shewanella schlegeliana]
MSKYTAPTFSIALLHPKYWGVLVIVSISYLCSLLPYSIQIRMGKTLGRIAIGFMKKRRSTIERNLELCFPEMDDAERELLVKQNIENTGLALFETGMAWFWSEARVARHMKVEGLEHIERLKAEGRGALLVAVHSLNLELGGRAFGLYNSGMGVYRPNNNPCFDYFQLKGRSRGGHTLIHRKNVKFMLEALNDGAFMWYAPDHDYGRRRSTFAPLFAVENACTTTGTSILVEGSDCAIVPIVMVRNDDNGHYTLTIKEPLIDQFPKGDENAGARFINKIVEASIMDAPSQYMWLHRRFKNRPDGESSLY